MARAKVVDAVSARVTDLPKNSKYDTSVRMAISDLCIDDH
jgi:hypothetical protein